MSPREPQGNLGLSPLLLMLEPSRCVWGGGRQTRDMPSPQVPPTLAPLLGRIARATDVWHMVENGAMRELGRPMSPHDGRRDLSAEQIAVEAVRYMLTFGEDGRRQVALKPSVEMHDYCSPERVDRTPAEYHEVWRVLADQCEDQALRARFHHLLFQARVPRAHLHARSAVDEYLAASESGWDRGDALDFGQAALRLAVAVKDTQRAQQAISAVQRNTEAAVAEGAPGLVASGLIALVGEKDLPFDFAAWADTFLGVTLFGYNADQVLAAWIAHAPVAERPTLWERRVRMAMDAAEAQRDTIVKIVALQQVLHLAEGANRPDLRKEAAARLQKAGRLPAQMMRFRSVTRLPKGLVEQEVERMIEGEGLGRSLVAWATWGPPTGRAKDNQGYAQQSASGLYGIIPMVVLTKDQLPAYTPHTPEERLDMEQVKSEVSHAETSLAWLGEALRRMGDRHGMPPQSSLAGFLHTWPGFDRAASWAISGSLVRYWARDSEAAFYTVLPQIERTMRNLLLWADEGIFREQRDQKPGQYPGIGALLDPLRTLYAMPDDWYRYYYACLVHPTGFNLRNTAAHGLLEIVSPRTAALALHLTLSLGLLTVRDVPQAPEHERPEQGDSAGQ